MNEVLYADSDTDRFKFISDKVWVLASQPISKQSGAAKQVGLSAALRSAIRFKHAGQSALKKRHTIRQIQYQSVRPKMVQAEMQASRAASLSQALKKAVHIKNGRCVKKIGPKIIAGTTVWTLTPKLSVQIQSDPARSKFAAALKRSAPAQKLNPEHLIRPVTPPVEEKLSPLVFYTVHPVQRLTPAI